MGYSLLWVLGVLAAPAATLCVSGKVVVTTASELADAIRNQESVISIESRITGTANENFARTSGVYALERYVDFPEVPEECLREPALTACLADPTYVRLAVPTTITSDTSALWDVGFLRRRLIVSANVTLDSVRLQGLAADVQPYIFFFLFSGTASLTCNNCTLEHSCGGGDASFFLQSMQLAALSQQNLVASADGMSATGSVMLRAAQDVTSGTRSGQEFVNGTFVCDHSILRGIVLDTSVRPEETCQLASDDGHSYRGTQNTTISGYTCQRWDTTEPVFHSRIPSAFPNAGLVDNYCRNPDNEADVWCYTVDGPRWEKCGVPLCDEAAAPAAAVAAAVAEPAATPLGGASPAAAAAAVTDVGVAQEDTNVALGDESALSFEEAAAPEGEQADAPTAVLAGVLAAVLVLVVAVAAVALLLHRRRRRWARDNLARDSASTLAKTTLYCGSHSSRTDDDGSHGGKGGTGENAALAGDAAAGLAAAGEDPDEVTTPDAAESTTPGSGGSTRSRRSRRSSRPAPAEELREALAEMEVDASQLVLHELVGRGGFGSVYRATWRGLNVAVKTVTFQERSSGGGAQARAIAEAAITFSLSHPNVIATYFHEIKPLQFAPDGAAAAAPPATSGRRNGAVSAAVLSDARLQDWKLFLVQEFCEGGSLRNLVDSRGFVNQHGRVKLCKCVECLVDIAQGMQYIQDKQVIHGDLTPSNVLIRPPTTPVPPASRQGSHPVDTSLVTSAAMPLPGPGFSQGSAAADPRAWHMLSGASGAAPPADSGAGPLAEAGSASSGTGADKLAAVEAPRLQPTSLSCGRLWHSPPAEPPSTPARDHFLPQPLPPPSASDMQFYSAMESMSAVESPGRSAASYGRRSGDSVGPTAELARDPGGGESRAGAGSGVDAHRDSATGAAQPLTEEFTVHIDAAPPEGARAANRHGDGGATQDPAQLALSLHQPARAYQAGPHLNGGGPGQAQSGAAWDTEPWRATAKISDFGLSMKLDPAAGHISNMRQGTPFYAAPEVRDAGFLSKAADTFSFGVIMWECFHCAPPYHVNRGGRIVRHPSFPDFPPDCPLSFAVLAISCLSENPADRPDFAQICGVLTDLAAHLRGKGDRATLSAHVTLSEVESHRGSSEGTAAVPAAGGAAGVESAISGLLSRCSAADLVVPPSSSDMSFLGSCRPVAGHSTSAMQSMQDVIRSVTAGRASERAHLLVAPRGPLPHGSGASSLSGSRPRSGGRGPPFHSGSAGASHASGGSGAVVSTASWHAGAPHSCQETIPEEDAELHSGTMDSNTGK